MKVKLSRSNFLDVLSHVQGVIERRNTLSILSNFLLECSAQGLQVRSSDTEMEVCEYIACDVEQVGSTTVSGQMLYEIIRKMPEGQEVTLYCSGNDLCISSGSCDFKLPVVSSQDFPVMDQEGYEDEFELSCGVLHDMLERCEFAMSSEETRYYLNGIYLHSHKEENGDFVLRFVSTDGHRLARCQIPCPSGASSMSGVIIPRKAVYELKKLLPDKGDDQVGIRVSGQKIFFHWHQIKLTSKLIEGEFPNYDRVIPKNNHMTCHVDVHALRSGVDRVSCVSFEKARLVTLSFQANELSLESHHPDYGRGSESIKGICYEGDGLNIGFNARYLLDILRQFPCDELTLSMKDEQSPILISSDELSCCIYVLMPMRI